MRDPSLAAAIGAMPGPDYGGRGGASFGHWGSGMGFGVDAPAAPMLPAPPLPPGHPAHMAHHAGPYGGFTGYRAHHGYPPFYDGRYGYYGHGMPEYPHPAHAAELWANMEGETARRARILDPNEHSRLKLERYSFSLSPEANFTLGTGPVAFDATLQPNTRLRAQRVLANAPCENFVILDSLQIANVNVFVGTSEDAWTYNPRAQGVMLDLPTLDPANRATVSGSYTGLLPANFASEFSFQFIVTFQGPSTMVGGL